MNVANHTTAMRKFADTKNPIQAFLSQAPAVFFVGRGFQLNSPMGYNRGTPAPPGNKKDSHETHVSWESELARGSKIDVSHLFG